MILTMWQEEDLDINTLISFKQRGSDFKAKESQRNSPEPSIALRDKYDSCASIHICQIIYSFSHYTAKVNLLNIAKIFLILSKNRMC